MSRFILRLGLVWLSFTLAACGGGLPAPALVQTALGVSASAEGPARDREAYVRLTAEALEQAVRGGDRTTVRMFTKWVEGADPDPAASRAILAQVIDQTAGVSVLSAEGSRMRRELADLAGRVSLRARTVPAREPIRLPVDEAVHPRALTEWWYLNGHLSDGRRRYGYEYTLFKVGPLLRWAHIALTDETSGRFRYLRQGIARRQALEAADRLDLTYGPHRLQAVASDRWSLSGRTDGAQLDLDFTTTKGPMMINGNGLIDMPEGDFSWYYSRTRLQTRGSLLVDGRRIPVTGLSWFDHQWGPFYVSGFKERWDWFSIQCEDGTDYNLFGFRKADGTVVARHANVLDAEGRLTTHREFGLVREAWWQSPVSRRWYTTAWSVALPGRRESFRLAATLPGQELARRTSFLLDPLPEYWEGSMKVTRTAPDGGRTGGFAYCEHFGFGERI
ncbi:MAG: lipocalin-like domain-containing protein [Candidatus Sericytochromatia bacterium]|nr:lipocalin-like domain-containing protein [Candidatus Sericytochromatia bacterium]